MAKFDAVWIENRFRHRDRMSGAGLYKDEATGFVVPKMKWGFTVEKKLTFLARFERCSNKAQVARSVPVDIQTVYDHVALDPVFRARFLACEAKQGRSTQLIDALEEREAITKQSVVTELLGKVDKYQ
jgi:hypothetical protein